MANQDRFYRKVGNLEEAQTAIHELTDHTYELRQQMSEMKDRHEKAVNGMHVQLAALGKGINSQICGLNVSGSPTANGQKLTWNAATGQLEWQ